MVKKHSVETVVITLARERTPVARLEAIHPLKKKRPGLMQNFGFVQPETFFKPLPLEELAAWEGEAG